MTDFSFGDVVVVPFPFTDQISAKKRPALVISTTGYHNAGPDVILIAVTSSLRGEPRAPEARITQWNTAGLLKPSTIKPIVFTIERSLIERTLGRLAPEDLAVLRTVVRSIIHLDESA